MRPIARLKPWKVAVNPQRLTWFTSPFRSLPKPDRMSADNARSLVQTRLSQAEVDEICAKHDRLWSSRPGGARAVFAFKDLSGAVLFGRNLCDADFTGAIM